MSENINPSLFEAIFKYATIGVLVTDHNGNIIVANQYILDKFGYTEKELLGQRVETLIPVRSRKVHDAERKTYYHHAETRAMGAGRDLNGLRKDGSEFPVEISLSPFHTEEGIFVISFIIDITVRKQKELAEMQSQKKMNQILSSLTKEKELNDMKSRFVSMASHEFRTPLSTILSSASLIRKYHFETEQPKREKHIERIISAVRNLTGILNEFLSIGKMEDGKIEVRYSVFNLKNLISSICNEIKDIRKTHQHISYTHEGDPEVCLDAELLRGVVINLLSNAIKFSGEGARIEIRSIHEKRKISISVKDSGMGIPVADQEHLFERFFRGNNVLNIQGTGLGLYIVGRYVELMKGSLSFESILGEGTTFTIIFKG